MTRGDKIEEVEREVGAVKMRLEEVLGQVGSVMGQMISTQDSLKILPELMAQIAALRKEKGSSDMAEPSRTNTAELGFREVRAQERHLMGAAFQEDRRRQVEMAEEFQKCRRRMERSFPPER